jgi:cold shock CspA family protein
VSAGTIVGQLTAATPAAAARFGTVVRFDDDTGLGVVEVDGAGQVPFHCTAIADGTRTIAPGTSVACRLGATHLGGVEAVGLVALAPAGS